MQFLCGPASVYIHELGSYHLAAAVEGRGLRVGNGGVLPWGARDWVVMRQSRKLSFQEGGGALQSSKPYWTPGISRSLGREVTCSEELIHP